MQFFRRCRRAFRQAFLQRRYALSHEPRLTMSLPSNLQPSMAQNEDDLSQLLELPADTLYEDIVHLPDDDPRKRDGLSALADLFMMRHQVTHDRIDLDKAISMYEDAVRLTQTGGSDMPARVKALGDVLLDRYDLQHNQVDLDKSIAAHERAMRLILDGDADKLGHLSSLGNSLRRRFERLGSLADIDKSIELQEEALRLTLDGDAAKPGRLTNLGSSLLGRFKRLGSLADIDKSIELQEEALRLTPDRDADKPACLNNLGSSLLGRFKRLGSLADIDKSIELEEEAVQLTSDGDAAKPGRLSNLGNSLLARFEHLGSLADIHKSIELQEEALRLTPDRDADKPGHLTNLGISLLCRFEHLRSLADIDKSIELQEEAVRLTLDRDAAKPGRLSNLGTSFLGRYEYLRSLANIDKSIELQEEAVQLTSDGDAAKPGRLSNLGNSLLARFEHLGSLADIHKSIELQEEALRLTPDRDAVKPACLNNLGNSLRRRFEHLGSLADIDKSIELQEEAVRLTLDGDAAKPSHLTNLGNSFLCCFERLGSLADIDKSIELQEEALRLTPDRDADKPACLTNLGNSLRRRFERLGSLADIDKSIELKEEALHLTPDGDAVKPSLLSNLGNSLQWRFERLGSLADIDKSIELQEKALRFTPDGDAAKPSHLTNLEISLSHRFERLGSLTDIDKSIELKEEAVQLTLDGDAAKPGRLINLGNSLLRHFERLKNVAELNSATRHFSCAASSSTGPPSTQFWAAVRWADCNHIADTSSMTAYRYALELLPRVAWLGLPVTSRHDELAKIGAIACAAAAAAIAEGHLDTAMEWLDQGRSIVWGQLLNLRSPVHALREQDSALADRLEQTSIALEHASNNDTILERGSQVSPEEAGRKHRQLALEWDELVDRARTLPELEDFLRPKRLLHLTDAARSGSVVVINVHKRRCDALMLMMGRDDVKHVPLNGLTYDRVKDLQVSLDQVLSASGVCSGCTRDPVRIDAHDTSSGFKEILSTLWLCIVKPVLESLDLQVSGTADPPRIWWCPTGPLTFLPLHAAGLYDTDEPGPQVSDFVTSSYTPTLTALLAPVRPIKHDEFKLLAITQPSTPGQTPLPGTEYELSRIHECAGKLHIRSLRGAEATVQRVIEAMKECDWIHLACHGAQDIDDPTNSVFFLQGGRLTLSEIIKTPLPHAELAFLSACKTASGDKHLSEEAVHLAAGMLLAGYRSVIATTWSIKDNDAPLVAGEVYGRFFKNGLPDSTQAAHALHHAVQRLRRSPGVSFISWVPFIHVGM